MGFIAPIIGVVSAVGGAISSANAAASQNAANELQIEANRRAEKIRLMDVEAQRESNYLDFELSSQQRVAALAATLTNSQISKLDNRTQRAIQSAQIGGANNAINVNDAKGVVDRRNTQENLLAQAAKARGIDTQNIPYEQLSNNVVTQRAAIMAALNPRMADMYRTGEESALLEKFDALRSAEGEQKVQVDYAQQYGDLLENFANTGRQVGDVAASYQSAAARNALNATDAMQQNAFAVNDSLFDNAQEMQALNTRIEQMGAYRKLVGGENVANAQASNIRSATSAMNAEVSRNNRSFSVFDYIAPIVGAGVSLFNSFGSSSSPQAPVNPQPSFRVSDSRYDPNYNYDLDYFG
jgi:hypothetical protein